MSPRVCVVVDGMKFQFDRKPTPAMIEQARADVAAIMANVPELTPEQIARQDAARARSHERLERIKRELGE